MTIKELLADARYDSIVFFLNEQGYTSPFDLSDYDFDELYFVPGVSDEAIEQCREILNDFINNQGSQENDNKQEIPNASIDTGEIPHQKSNPVIWNQTDDFSSAISDVISRIAAALEVVENRERFDQFRAAFLETPDYCKQYDFDLFSLLCDEIDVLIIDSNEAADSCSQYTYEESKRLSAVTVEDVFAGVPRGRAMISFCREKNIKTLLDLEKIDFDDIEAKGLGPESLKKCRKVYLAKRDAVLAGEIYVPEPEKTPQERFVKAYSNLPERERICLIARAQGMTLQATGELYGLTRERIRQIIKKAIRRLGSFCGAVFNSLSAGHHSICTPDLKAAFAEQDLIEVAAYLLKQMDTFCYFPFADKYVRSKNVPKDWNDKLQQIAKNVIGDSINYFDNLELIDEQLSSEGISFIDSIDYMGYLLEHGYKAIGDYVVKKSQAYRNMCLNVIRRHFQDGIKLDSDENNADMIQLREIVHREFGDAGLPESNRPLTARVSPALILCGRGRYISPENAAIDLPLIEQIVDYINASSETSLYYAEIFSVFSGRLLAQTGIDNYNYLHGVLKAFYPDEFIYERDLLVKKGTERIPFEIRLSQLLKDNRHAMTTAEIQSKMLGVSYMRIINALIRLPEIIQWDYNAFNHIENLQLTDDDICKLGAILSDLTNKQSGYCSENVLYNAVSTEMHEFVMKNSIHNSRNLFYIASYFFTNEYRFSRPHIASDKFPNIELTNANIAGFFIGDSRTLTYPDLVEMNRRAGWSPGAFTLVLNAVEKDYCRISLNDYILKTDFQISDDALSRIKQAVADLTAASGYYGIFAIYNYDSFPSVQFEWNEFLLQTVMEKYSLGFKILEPNTKDRRYKRGIIVPDSCPCSSYEDFVIEQMKSDHIQKIPEDEFSNYLRRKGLVLTSNIPQELYDGDGVRLENGSFVYE